MAEDPMGLERYSIFLLRERRDIGHVDDGAIDEGAPWHRLAAWDDGERWERLVRHGIPVPRDTMEEAIPLLKEPADVGFAEPGGAGDDGVERPLEAGRG